MSCRSMAPRSCFEFSEYCISAAKASARHSVKSALSLIHIQSPSGNLTVETHFSEVASEFASF